MYIINTADCFEPDSAIAATMGITKQQRLKPDAVLTLFKRQAPQHLGARGSTGDGSRISRKRLALLRPQKRRGSAVQRRSSSQGKLMRKERNQG